MATHIPLTWQLPAFPLIFSFFRFLPWQNILCSFLTPFPCAFPFCRVKKTTARAVKHTIRDPLERLHSKLSTGGNSDVHEAPGDKTVAAPPTVPTNSDASG